MGAAFLVRIWYSSRMSIADRGFLHICSLVILSCLEERDAVRNDRPGFRSFVVSVA